MEYTKYYNIKAMLPSLPKILDKVTSPKEFGQKYINSNKRKKRR